MSDELMIIPTPARIERLGGFVEMPQRLSVLGAPASMVRWALGERGVPVDFADTAPTLRCECESPADVPPVMIEDQRSALLIQVPLRAGDSPVRIRAASLAGLRHALVTLGQLLARFGTRLPALSIADAPAFAIRGVMLDVSRDRVPTLEELLRISDTLARLKVNHLQLYTEHTFAYRGHEEVWRDASPITPQDIRVLDEHCRARGIELAANQNCFGHLARWLSLPRYAPLAETHGDWMFDAWPRSGPFSLCPTDPRSEEFVADLLGQLLPNFTSPSVNIGCDETYDIAYGRSKDEVRRRGRETVYLEFVRKICRRVGALGKRPMFWADIALHNPACIEQIPAELLSLAWGYEPDAPFSQWCELLRGAGREVWVCPGTSSWRSIVGRTSERTANIAAAAACAGRVPGMLVCDWGDVGHRQQWPVALHAIAHGSAAAWNPRDAGAFNARASAMHALGDPTGALGPWLEELGDVDHHLRLIGGRYSHPEQAPGQPLRNASTLFADLHSGLHHLTDLGTSEQWNYTLTHIDQLSRTLPPGGGELIQRELRHTLDVARFAAGRGAARRRPGGLEARLRGVLSRRLEEIIHEHRALWLVRSRPGGLERSSGHYQRTLEELRA